MSAPPAPHQAPSPSPLEGATFAPRSNPPRSPHRSWAMRGLAHITLTLTLTHANAGPPFITDDPVPVDTHHWEIYLYADGAAGAGGLSGLGPETEINYGLIPNLQIHIASGLAFNAPTRQPATLGPSDTELGAKIRVITPGEQDWWPQIAIFPLIELPTGNARRGLGAGQTQFYIPLWLQKDFGKWTTYGGGGYWINPGPGNRNYAFTGWLLQRQITEKLALGAELFHQTSSQIGRHASNGYNLGAIYDLSEHQHILLSAGQGTLQYSINPTDIKNPLTYYLAFQCTF